MSATLDDAAFMEAFEAYWNAGRTDEGLKAAIATYIDRMDLGFLHSLTVSSRKQKIQQRARNCAHARITKLFGTVQ